MLELIIKEWRDAREDIFNNTSKISEENTSRWKRLSDAEHDLMQLARNLK